MALSKEQTIGKLSLIDWLTLGLSTVMVGLIVNYFYQMLAS